MSIAFEEKRNLTNELHFKPRGSTFFRSSGLSHFPHSGSEFVREFIEGEQGAIETISIEPSETAKNRSTLYFLVGWWGGATDYLDAMRYFSELGYRCRCFSWRGTGQSEGGSFWGYGYEDDLLRVLRHFRDERLVLIAHSGAIDYVRPAVPELHRESGIQIEAAIFIAPLSRSGSMGALMRWLRPDGSGTDLTRFIRFLGSNLLGVSWFMRNELALRRVLLSDHVSPEVVEQVWRQIDRCPFGRYFRSLWRFLPFLQHRPLSLRDFGIEHSIVFHCELDRNFAAAQQRNTAVAMGAEFGILPKTCHQWFADPASFAETSRQIIQWLGEKLPRG